MVMAKFAVGDEIRHREASEANQRWTVLGVGDKKYFLRLDMSGDETTSSIEHIDENFVKAPETITRYFNMYRNRDGSLTIGDEFITRAAADRYDSHLRVACKKVTIVIGEYDD
jgi:hypothetical protein